MKKAFTFLGAGLIVALMAGATFAQRPRSTNDSTQPVSGASSVQKPPPAPQTFKAKYEGGIFAYNKKQTGTLTFDDVNKRLVFRTKEQQEYVSLPYAAVNGAFADTRSLRPTGATVVGSLPLPYGANIPALFIKKKYRYLTLQYSDPDSRSAGITSFKLENKELLNSVLHTLAEKAELEARGDGFVRRKAMPVVAPEM
jgi:hypothetical protein